MLFIVMGDCDAVACLRHQVRDRGAVHAAAGGRGNAPAAIIC
jgi:hypothetical protein